MKSTVVRDRLIKKITDLVKECKTPNDLKSYKIPTKDGFLKSIDIEKMDIMFYDEDGFGKESRVLFTGLRGLKIGTILQVIDGLKMVNQYDKLIDNLKSKEDYWDQKQGKWTYRPIDKEKVRLLAREYVLEGRRTNTKYVATLKKS